MDRDRSQKDPALSGRQLFRSVGNRAHHQTLQAAAIDAPKTSPDQASSEGGLKGLNRKVCPIGPCRDPKPDVMACGDDAKPCIESKTCDLCSEMISEPTTTRAAPIIEAFDVLRLAKKIARQFLTATRYPCSDVHLLVT
jgi:hypothetical protein